MMLRQLQYFLDLAETEHLTKSASNLFVTQSTISHGVTQLEKELGIALFENRAWVGYFTGRHQI